MAAWRKLFAIGGAPAASHVTLSRAPSADRLLDPLAGARVAHATSLEALTRPLDVAGLLSRVADAALNAENPNVDAPASDTRARRTRTPPLVAPAQEVESARAMPAAVSTTRTRAATHSEAKSSSRRAPLIPRPYEERGFDTTPATDASPATARPRFAAHANRVDEIGARVAVAQSAMETRGTLLRQNAPLAHRLGANARVLLDEPVANVQRLLAIGAPAPAASTRAMASPARASEKATHATSKPSTPDVARLLAAAVDRVGAPNVGMSPTPSEALRSYVSKPLLASPTPEPLRGGNVPVAASDAEHVGGFRGLAQRALKPTNGARQVQVQRIEPETRVPSDLAFDTLDDKVADSLARVLAREARRHGIDLAEARS